jgi:predicted patatin/cPLA2 family phospholipase
MEEVGEVRSIVRDLFYPEACGKNGVKRWRICVVPPGGKSGVQSAGVLNALEDCGIPATHFDIIKGSSAGAYNTTAYCAQHTGKLRSVYEHLCDVPFLFPQWWNGEWMRWGWWYGDFMNLQYLHKLLVEFGFDTMPRHAWPDLRIGVSDMQGRLVLKCGRSAPSVLDLCRASSSVLPLTCGVQLDGDTYVDGGHAHPCPVKELVRSIYARGEEADVLVIANRSHPRHMSYAEWMVFQTFVHTWLPWYSWRLYESTRQFDTKIERTAQMASKPRSWIRIGLLFPEPHDAVSQIEARAHVVKLGGHTAYWQASQLLGAARPVRQI